MMWNLPYPDRRHLVRKKVSPFSQNVCDRTLFVAVAVTNCKSVVEFPHPIVVAS